MLNGWEVSPDASKAANDTKDATQWAADSSDGTQGAEDGARVPPMASRAESQSVPGIGLNQFNTATADAFGKATERRLTEAWVMVPL